MGKLNKKIILTVLTVVILVGAIGFYLYSAGNDAAGGEIGVVKTGSGGFPASLADATVYAVADKYLEALVTSDQHKVLELLTAEHRADWKEESYLLSERAFQEYDEIILDDVKLGVIQFYTSEGKTLASLLTTYSVIFKKGEKVETRVNVEEELGLSQEGDRWLIGQSLRTLLSAEK